jgi:hypothetical protein
MEEQWWGAVSLTGGACLEKQIGPLSVAIRRVGSELRLFYAEHTRLYTGSATEPFPVRFAPINGNDDTVTGDTVTATETRPHPQVRG